MTTGSDIHELSEDSKLPETRNRHVCASWLNELWAWSNDKFLAASPMKNPWLPKPLALPPSFFLARWLVIHYRASIGAWLVQTKVYHTFAASQLYNVYRWFRP